MNKDIILENSQLRLTVGPDCIAKSLIHKASGQECLAAGEDAALFSVTQERPFNNEVKLAHPNKRTTFQANRIRREGNRLYIRFEIVPVEAVVEIHEAPMYIAFTLADFIVHPGDYEGLRMDTPPVSELRLLQLPILNRKNFGEWLNVSWDDEVAVNVLATSPYARIDSERRKGCRILTADAVRGIKLKGCGAALICTASGSLMDAIASLEEDYDLPRGVESRRSPSINRSAYWSTGVTPDTVDTHIAYAKQAGFRHMLIYYPAIFEGGNGYGRCGDYDYRKEYPNGAADVKKMLDKIKAAGITPGIHFLQTHIGRQSRYVTPVADRRLNLTRTFTLSRPLEAGDTQVYVDQNPEGCVMDEACRILQFDGELIHYDGYTTEYPYYFTGCTRGYWDTNAAPHALGCRGGILDVSEYGATSCYLDQNTDLQDEVAVKLADAYDAGFQFIYFDGSEGTNPPFAFHVPNAQYRVLKKLGSQPLFTEGAAKAHFSWHFLSGGNAFDVFPMDVFKAKIAQFPAEEAPRMRQDFTRLNFGWWAYREDTQPDMYEYGTSRAAAWDCPVTMMENLEVFRSNPRTPDTLEVLRRWEEVRVHNWLTDAQKEALKNLDQEHILLIDEQGQFELQPYDPIPGVDSALSAFLFERKGRRYVVYWHKTGSASVKLPLDASSASLVLEKELGGQRLDVELSDGAVIIPAAGRCYLSSDLSREALSEAFAKAQVLE